MRRKIAIAIGLVAALLVVGLLLYFLSPLLNPPRPGVTQENFRRVHKGMSEEEVEAILGGPGEPAGFMMLTKSREWRGPDCVVSITFGLITGAGAIDGSLTTDDGLTLELTDEPPDTPFVKRLVEWLGFRP
jgi:hypothetical protein